MSLVSRVYPIGQMPLPDTPVVRVALAKIAALRSAVSPGLATAMQSLKTTGDLRQLLAQTMLAAVRGEVPSELQRSVHQGVKAVTRAISKEAAAAKVELLLRNGGEFLRRAKIAYSKTSATDQPGNTSDVREVDGVVYAVLCNVNGTLAVSRVLASGRLKRQESWPEALAA